MGRGKHIKLKFSLLLFAGLIPAIFFSGQMAPIKTTAPQFVSSDTSFRALVRYGDFVFQREKCSRCHILAMDSSSRKISLDGIGIRSTEVYLYFQLTDPRYVRVESKMPSFQRLFKRNFQWDDFEYELEETDEKVLADLRSRILVEADSFLVKFEPYAYDFTESIARTEGLALIAFLKSIPSSPELYRVDSVDYAKRTAPWDTFEVKSKNTTSKTVAKPDTYAVARSTDPEIIAIGKTRYQQYCAACHGQNGEGLVGPNLTDDYWIHGNNAEDIFNIIRKGAIEKGMIAWESTLNPKEIASIVAYIRSIHGSNPLGSKAPQGKYMK